MRIPTAVASKAATPFGVVTLGTLLVMGRVPTLSGMVTEVIALEVTGSTVVVRVVVSLASNIFVVWVPEAASSAPPPGTVSNLEVVPVIVVIVVGVPCSAIMAMAVVDAPPRDVVCCIEAIFNVVVVDILATVLDNVVIRFVNVVDRAIDVTMEIMADVGANVVANVVLLLVINDDTDMLGKLVDSVVKDSAKGFDVVVLAEIVTLVVDAPVIGNNVVCVCIDESVTVSTDDVENVPCMRVDIPVTGMVTNEIVGVVVDVEVTAVIVWNSRVELVVSASANPLNLVVEMLIEVIIDMVVEVRVCVLDITVTVLVRVVAVVAVVVVVFAVVVVVVAVVVAVVDILVCVLDIVRVVVVAVRVAEVAVMDAVVRVLELVVGVSMADVDVVVTVAVETVLVSVVVVAVIVLDVGGAGVVSVVGVGDAVVVVIDVAVVVAVLPIMIVSARRATT